MNVYMKCVFQQSMLPFVLYMVMTENEYFVRKMLFNSFLLKKNTETGQLRISISWAHSFYTFTRFKFCSGIQKKDITCKLWTINLYHLRFSVEFIEGRQPKPHASTKSLVIVLGHVEDQTSVELVVEAHGVRQHGVRGVVEGYSRGAVQCL